MTAQLFEEHQPLIQTIARGFAIQNALDMEEVESESYAIYVDTVESYRPGDISFRTWIARRVKWDLTSWNRRNAQKKQEEFDFIKETCWRQDWTHPKITELTDDLGRDAKKVVEMVLKAPLEMLEASRLSGNKRRLGTFIKEDLRSQGWSCPKIWRVWKEIREALKGW